MSWSIRKLGNVVQPRRGKVSPRDFPNLPYVGLEHVEAHTSRLVGFSPTSGMKSAASRFFPGDVLYSRLRPYLNKVWRADREGLCSSEFIVLPGNDAIDADFLRYRLNSADFVSFANSLNAGDRPRVDFEQISEFETWLPSSLREQRRIVAEIEKQFTCLEAGIAALRRVQANLKRYRAAVLKAACEGRLVPTEADLARKKGRTFETGEQLLQRILTDRRRNWAGRGKYNEPQGPKHTASDALPAGWTWATFEQLSERVTVGFVGSMKHEYVASGIPFLRGQNVRENRFCAEGLLYVSQAFHDSLQKSALRPGDIAVVRSGVVGVTCVIPPTLKEANCSDLVLVQRPLGIVPQYGAYYMNSLAKRHVEAGKVGVALTHFNTKSVAALAVPLPPLAEQERIVAEVERRLSVIDDLEIVVSENLTRGARLRQSMLQQAFATSTYDPTPITRL